MTEYLKDIKESISVEVENWTGIEGVNTELIDYSMVGSVYSFTLFSPILFFSCLSIPSNSMVSCSFPPSLSKCHLYSLYSDGPLIQSVSVDDNSEGSEY